MHEKAPENIFDTYLNPIFSLEYDGTDMIREKKAQEIAKDTQKNIEKLNLANQEQQHTIEMLIKEINIIKSRNLSNVKTNK